MGNKIIYHAFMTVLSSCKQIDSKYVVSFSPYLDIYWVVYRTDTDDFMLGFALPVYLYVLKILFIKEMHRAVEFFNKILHLWRVWIYLFTEMFLTGSSLFKDTVWNSLLASSDKVANYNQPLTPSLPWEDYDEFTFSLFS